MTEVSTTVKSATKSNTIRANLLGAIGGAVAAIDPGTVVSALTAASSMTGGNGEIVIPTGQVTASGIVLLLWSVVNALMRLKTGKPVSLRIGK
ncbi:hypothetical protein [Poseidonocella sp. HB161398]|uniref:hypothetical protein n=1 Tax=Poseidonocella sp. HB161398 TaxID=2320855 RepID=UPI001107E3A8|nr:hypothetical protein [Poseidonocella sp. HB161398]